MYAAARRLLDAVLTDEDGAAYRDFWAERKPPALAVSLVRPDTLVLARPSVLFRALDEYLVKVPRAIVGAEAIDARQQRAFLFERLRREIFAARGEDWPSSVPSHWTLERIPVALRIDYVRRYLEEYLVPIMILAEDRLHVLRVWNDPSASSLREDGRDTSQSLLAELLGEASGVFRSGDEPSRTPMRDTRTALLGEAYVTSKGVEIAAQLEADMRAGAADASHTYNETTNEYLSGFVDRLLFAEHPRAQGEKLTKRITDRTKRYEETFEKLRSRARTASLQSEQHEHERDSAKITLVTLPTEVFIGIHVAFDRLNKQLVDCIAVDAPRLLRKTDFFAPRINAGNRAREFDDLYRQAYLHRIMEAEQSAVTGALVALRNKLGRALAVWHDDVVAKLSVPETVRAALSLLLPDGSSSIRPEDDWHDRYTNTRHVSWRTEALTRLLAKPIRAQVKSYQDLFDEHLKTLTPYARELSDESNSSLRPPNESFVRRTLKLYEACVAVRDTVLPLLASADERTRLVARVDGLVGAHLAYVSAYAVSASADWKKAWRGTLPDATVETLLAGTTNPEKWFTPAKKEYAFDAERLQMTETPAVVPRRWAAPMSEWFDWLKPGAEVDADAIGGEEPDETAPPSAPSTTLPVVLVEDVPVTITDAPVSAQEAIDMRKGKIESIVDDALTDPGKPVRFNTTTPIGKVIVAEATRAFVGRFYAPLYEGTVARVMERLDDIDDEVRRIAAQFGTPAPATPKKPTNPEARATVNAVTEAVAKLVGTERKKRG